MAKSVPQLLREAAQALERSANAAPSDSERPSSSLRMTPPDRSGGTRGKLARKRQGVFRQTVRLWVASFHSGSRLCGV